MSRPNYEFFTALPSASGTAPVSTGYGYNDANQRVRAQLADGSAWVYDYDSLGQVKSGKRYWSDGTPVAGQQYEYAFDDIGNRKSTKVGGDSAGANLRASTYTLAGNGLNQYASRTVSNILDVLGASVAGATVQAKAGGFYMAEARMSDAPSDFAETRRQCLAIENFGEDVLRLSPGRIVVAEASQATLAGGAV